MGQRLVVNVFKTHDEDSRIANVYFHWSGYTENAYGEVSEMMKVLSGIRDQSDDDIRKKLILFYRNRPRKPMSFSHGMIGRQDCFI